MSSRSPPSLQQDGPTEGVVGQNGQYLSRPKPAASAVPGRVSWHPHPCGKCLFAQNFYHIISHAETDVLFVLKAAKPHDTGIEIYFLQLDQYNTEALID